ncbi:Transmembrane protein [Trema orientale]|uniref:Transmembrane protein n=1 Tax=Trema orientale TaxID=63057 RepID=A0A2P5FG20_TREOI|nr:Transmembrane protein [Trema orientale]
MGLSLTTKTTTISLPLLSFSALLFLLLHNITQWPAFYYLSILALFAAVLVIGLGLVATARAAMVTCITVMVLLTFAGNRRRVLVKRGKMITNDVAMFMVGVLVKERGFLAAASCATVFSIMAVIGIKEAQFVFL